uniref:Uncharacterized protein n=1 Tax=Meloidogyne hapla TaxID=6305 RepID=A0A1I8B8E0_MELHA
MVNANAMEVIKENVGDIEGFLIKAKENACECTYGLSQLCELGNVVNCHSIKGVLSIFAVDLFVTAIDVDGFDHLLGKWPFHIYKNFEENENLNQGGDDEN